MFIAGSVGMLFPHASRCTRRKTVVHNSQAHEEQRVSFAMTPNENYVKKASKALAILNRNPRADYEVVKQWSQQLRRNVDELIALRFQAAFNQRLASMPQESYEEKKALCRWANEELRTNKLAIRCPKTGQAAILHAAPGNHPEAGCFQVELLGAESGRRRTKDSPSLFTVELIPRSPRSEPLADFWRDKVNSSKGGSRDQAKGSEKN